MPRHCVIEMGTPKNGKGRVVGLPAFLADGLSAYVATISRGGLLFLTSAAARCAARTGNVGCSTLRLVAST